jgi:hypothetical protein
MDRLTRAAFGSAGLLVEWIVVEVQIPSQPWPYRLRRNSHTWLLPNLVALL